MPTYGRRVLAELRVHAEMLGLSKLLTIRVEATGRCRAEVDDIPPDEVGPGPHVGRVSATAGE